MQIETQITYTRYRKVMYYMTYSRPVMILTYISILGLLIFSALQLTGKMPVTDMTDVQLLVALLYLLYHPIRSARYFRKSYNSNLRLQEKLQFEFTPEKVITKGESFSSEMSWDKLYKIVEIADCFLLYSDHKQAHFIPKEHFSSAQLDEFRALVRATGVISKLK